MKILDLSVDVKMDNYNCEHVHTFSLAKRLALLGHKITLIIKGEETIETNHYEKFEEGIY